MPSRATVPPSPLVTPEGLSAITSERVREIEWMRDRVNSYVQFVSQVGSLQGVSAEAKEKTVAAFHERMTKLVSQLSRIHDELQLG